MFFGYNPLKWRLGLMFLAVCVVVLAAWATASASVLLLMKDGSALGSNVVELARVGISFGLLAAILTVLYRIRPRAGWGVELTPTVLRVSRATRGLIETPWSLVREARFVTFERDAYAIFLEEEHRILVPRHLFARRADFDAVVKAIDERIPKRADA